MYRPYRELASSLIVIRTYVLPYPLLALWTFGLTFLLTYVFPSLAGLVYAFLFVNYYILFLLAIGILVGRFRIVRRIFEVYNHMNLKKAQKLASEYSHVVNVMTYEVGSDHEVDEILDEIWHHRGYPLPQVKKLETVLCEMQIIKINKAMETLERMRKRTGVEERMLCRLREERAEYIDKIKRIQEFGD